MKKFTLKVQEIKKETPDTVTLCFKQPNLRKIKYQAGQYLTLSFRINDRKYSRPYSFSSSPSVDTFIEVTIKRVPGGIVSNYIFNEIQIGDSIEVMEPMGDFVYDFNDTNNSVYFWGVGSGITPLISMIKEILHTNPAININLIYGNKNQESSIFLETLDQLKEKYSAVFKIWHFQSQSVLLENSDNIYKGRINSDFISKILKDNSDKNTSHFICGPQGLKNTIKETINSLGCSFSKIHTEDFELVKNPKDFEYIQTQKIKISYLGVETEVEIEKGKSILDGALDLGIEIPYSCQTGSCSTCKAQLISGDLKMIGLNTPRLDLNSNEFLLCCSYPINENVKVEILKN